MTILETRHETWSDERACERCARALAARVALGNAFIELNGTLGAGKTTFVRHLLRALGVEGRIKSPTYAVLEPYALPGLDIAHFEFYRFNDAREWEDAGFRDIFARPGLKLVEWAERARAVLPVADLRMDIEVLDNDTRRVTLHALTPLGVGLLR